MKINANNAARFNDPNAANAPAANNNESPGKNGAIISPVSQKMTMKITTT